MLSDTTVDVLIVGAGISGINVAYRLQERCPELTYTVLEGRAAIGGTWDLFRYPGIRSDSDIYTLSFPFYPWRGRDSIVDGAEIFAHMEEAARHFGIDRHIRLNSQVRAAHWSSADERWTVRVDANGTEQQYTARFLVVCTGYYDYDSPHDAALPGLESFEGTLVHPQFWPDDLEVEGRRVAVIGSGATAITLVPALAERGASVTMIQRTPSYVLAYPRRDPVADVLRRLLPAKAAHHVMRATNAGLQWGLYQASRRAPKAVTRLLRHRAIAGVGSAEFVDQHLTPPYGPWDQRLCVARDADFFRAIRGGAASVVTGRIDRITPTGVQMADGREVECDVLVTATGLRVRLFGGTDLTIDGEPVDLASTYVYQGAMLSGVPNLAFALGYLNLSWTMRTDLTARFVARVLRRLTDSAATVVTPVLPDDLEKLGPPRPLLDMKAGYLTRAAAILPRATGRYPWTLAQNIVRDAWAVNRADLDDGLEWGAGPAVSS